MYMYMNDQSLRLGKAKQLRLKTTPFFSREKEELPQAGPEPVTLCIPGMYVHLHVHVYITLHMHLLPPQSLSFFLQSLPYLYMYMYMYTYMYMYVYMQWRDALCLPKDSACPAELPWWLSW